MCDTSPDMETCVRERVEPRQSTLIWDMSMHTKKEREHLLVQALEVLSLVVSFNSKVTLNTATSNSSISLARTRIDAAIINCDTLGWEDPQSSH